MKLRRLLKDKINVINNLIGSVNTKQISQWNHVNILINR